MSSRKRQKLEGGGLIGRWLPLTGIGGGSHLKSARRAHDAMALAGSSTAQLASGSRVRVWNRSACKAMQLGIPPLGVATLLTHHSVEYSTVQLNDALCDAFRLHGLPFSRMDYASVPTEWLAPVATPSSGTAALSAAAAAAASAAPVAAVVSGPVLRAHLYEVVVGDIVRIYPHASAYVSQKEGAARQRSWKAFAANSLKLDQLTEPNFQPSPPVYLQASTLGYGLVLRVLQSTTGSEPARATVVPLDLKAEADTTAASAAETAAAVSVPAKTRTFPVDRLEVEYSRPSIVHDVFDVELTQRACAGEAATTPQALGCRSRALRVDGLEACFANRNRAQFEQLFQRAQKLLRSVQ
jgi:hypothetical protein